MLLLSVAGNAEQLQQLLAEEGCDVNQADEEGRTALHFAGEQLCFVTQRLPGSFCQWQTNLWQP